MASRQCMLAVEQLNIGRENYDGLIADRQKRQNFPPSKFCTIRYDEVPIKLNICDLICKNPEQSRKVKYSV